MRKHIRYITIFIIGILLFGSIDVYADDDLCELSNKLNPTSSVITVCTLTGKVKTIDADNSSNNKTEEMTINIKYTPGYGLWELEVKRNTWEEIRKTSFNDLFKGINSGDYSPDANNLTCPKSFSSITYKATKKIVATNYDIQKIDFSKSKGKAELTTDFPSSIKSYSKNMVSKINKYECSDKNLKKIKDNMEKECNVIFCSTDTTPKYVLEAYGNKKGQKFLDACLASGTPLTELIKQPQKDILSAMKKKIESCKDCSKYEDSEDKENCEENVEQLESKAEVTEKSNDFWDKKVASADARINEQPIRILDTPINNPDDTCSGMFGEKVSEDLKLALKYIQYIGPILVIVLGILDFIKAVASGSSETFNVAWKKLLKRLIVAILLFFIVVLLKFVFKIFGIIAPADCFK